MSDVKAEIIAKLLNSWTEVGIALSVKHCVLNLLTEIEETGLFSVKICLGELILLMKARSLSLRPKSK